MSSDKGAHALRASDKQAVWTKNRLTNTSLHVKNVLHLFETQK